MEQDVSDASGRHDFGRGKPKFQQSEKQKVMNVNEARSACQGRVEWHSRL